MNPWLVIDPAYSMWYDGMESEVEWDEYDDDEEEYEEPEFKRPRHTLIKKRTIKLQRR